MRALTREEVLKDLEEIQQKLHNLQLAIATRGLVGDTPIKQEDIGDTPIKEEDASQIYIGDKVRITNGVKKGQDKEGQIV